METRIFLLAVAAALWTTAVAQTKTITQQQYWLDGDISSAQTAGASVDISGFPSGVHTYSVRVKDSEGLWSAIETRFFVIPRAVEMATNIAEREYWIDDHFAARATLGDSPAQISLTALQAGLHMLSVRVKDNTGRWSSSVTQHFIVPTSLEPATIARYMYWFDDDTENLISGELMTPTGVLPIVISHLSEGEHTLSWRVADSKGVWSNTMVETFTFTRIQLTDVMVSLADNWFEYAGEEIRPAVTVTDGETVLTKDVDYTVSYADNIYPGTASVIIYAVENGLYKGEVTKTFTIDKAVPQVTAPTPIEGLAYTGEPQILAKAGITTGGELQYSLDADTWSTEIPSATNAGEYQVYYQVIGDANYHDIVINWIYANIEKAASVVVTPPIALEGLQTKGESVVLITAGESLGGEMQYSLDGENYNSELPTVTEEGTYTVYYKVVGDENHNDTEADTIIVVVVKSTTDIESIPADQVHYIKVLMDGQLLILHGDQIYNAQGARVK